MFAVIIADQFTKWWIMTAFDPLETRVIVPGFFNLTFITNTGAAFGMFAGEQTVWRQVFFVGVALLALVALFFAYKHLKDQGWYFVYAIGLIAGGAAGNVVDRFRYGAVVDFLDFYIKSYHWPAFNVADSAITVGVGLFLLGNILVRPDDNAEVL
jgi:signal peptidase II